MTLFYLTRYSETLTKRKTDAEKALKQHNQSQPTTECNNVKSDRNQYCISTYPPSRMLERKDNWAAAGGLTWEKQPDNWREKSWNRLRVHVLPRRDWGDGEKYLSSCFQIIIGTLEMYLKKNRKTEKASNLFLQLRNSEKCSLLGCFGGFFVFDNFAYHTQHNAGTFFSTGFRLAVHRETKMNKRDSKKTHCVVMSNYQHHMEWVSENQSRVTDSKSCCTLYLFIFALVSKRSWRRNNVNYYSTPQMKHITWIILMKLDKCII